MPDTQLKIGLSFTADTSKARQEMDKLKNDLSKIVSTTNVGQMNTVQFKNVIDQAAQLRGILEQATKSTGKLDLSKFERGLKAANIDLNTMAREFKNIDGGAFFNDLAKQVMAADTGVNILSGRLKKFAQGLMNTAMWTIQSNAIHAVQSALQGAYGYAQKLNKGLTDIAIVSDLNTQQLTEFAKTANQMAKELSASTADYVSGALIYYQAGLSDEEVIERTNTTIRLAQTSGESAEAISSYMTAIWNNFYDGSKSVEYYADAISYLGAVTAASNADIAEGMQSFSAVADTVGLSFEYGAAALTTLRDITQQSASTIGNSLKTIFARLSSVKQGESLEDGVDFTKYSAALEQVGVNILDANGELRNMDSILDDLAIRWEQLNNAQKVALAQTVGGVRQYNNLISLMDNYERFQELVQETQGSDGYLQHQAEIYAESWEGAKNRLTAAWQGIYDQLIDDKFFIKVTNFFADLVNFIGEVIRGAGGLKGVISMLVMGITSLDPERFTQHLRNIHETLLLIKDALTGVQEKANIDLKSGFLDIAFTQNAVTDNSEIMKLMDDEVKMLEKINILEADGKTIEAETLKVKLDRHAQELQALIENEQELQKTRDLLQEISDVSNVPDSDLHSLEKLSTTTARWSFFAQDLKQFKGAKTQEEKFEIAVDLNARYKGKAVSNILDAIVFDGKSPDEAIAEAEAKAQQGIAEIITKIRSYTNTFTENGGDKEGLKQLLGITDESLKLTNEQFSELTDKVTGLQQAKEMAGKAGSNVSQEEVIQLTEQEAIINALIDKLLKYGELTVQQRQELERLRRTSNEDGVDWANVVTGGIRAASSLTAMSAGMNSLIDSFKNGNITLGSFVGSLSSVWMGARTATTAFASMGKMLSESTGLAGALGSAFT